MRIDFGGYIDGNRAFRIIGTDKVFNEMDLTNVDISLRIENGQGYLEVKGAATHEEDCKDSKC